MLILIFSFFCKKAPLKKQTLKKGGLQLNTSKEIILLNLIQNFSFFSKIFINAAMNFFCQNSTEVIFSSQHMIQL